MKAVITVIGKDMVGILAKVSTVCAEKGINVIEVTQSILQDMFAMIMIVDISAATVQELAVMLDMTEAEVAAAIHKFEKDGVIKGYRTLINWERTDVHRASALIELRVTPKKDSGFDELAARVKAFPEVESVCLMSGGFDLAVTVTANTMSEIAMFVAKRLAPIDGVLSTATHFILTKYKDGGVEFVTDYDEIDERGSNLCD